MSLYTAFRPLLFRLPPERAHAFTLWALKSGLLGVGGNAGDPVLETEVWGKRFANPLGISAGFDKNAEVMAPLLRLGFGFVEVGSITPKPQAGNPRPRVFRLPQSHAVINRLGFNNEGIAGAEPRLRAFRADPTPGVLGVNLGKNKQGEARADYGAGTRALAPHADYLVINVSSPNTPGLRALQGRAELEGLIAAVRAELPDPPPPLVLKIAPDLTEADKRDIAEVALASLDGLIVSNTTLARPESLDDEQRQESGGLSGRPLFDPSTRLLAEMYRLTEERIPLIGVGGVEDGATAYAKIRAGASLVQLYTALIYQGPDLVRRIKRELADLLKQDGFAQVGEAVGADAGKG
ncbi:quinone-dependent dihydroorotate dehydrogenase [Algihabitans albus]|uniref:quinone-dependent dihydroorotate dehydrogenase n=1 Tax=Algihabitans albus TaxID=2164067 RepID=UPI000E5D22B6|nr:quinone-dependent dihydroorotate dehydrogenase [Algihabitans albus]